LANGVLEADVVTATDYYPFGMSMPGRKYVSPNSESFRYGFNGKEKDLEATGTTTYDYGFRIYNPALGKFLSVDPLTGKYPELTPYQFSSNSPISGIDLDGLEFFFAAGSGNDGGKGASGYVGAIIQAFEVAGISNVIQINAHKSRSQDIDFAVGGYANRPYNDLYTYQTTESETHFFPPMQVITTTKVVNHDNPNVFGFNQGAVGGTKKIEVDDRITKSVNDVKANRKEGSQLNLCGYSFGSVLMAQTALKLADENIKVDKLILIGTPINTNSELYKTLSKYKQEGKIGNIIITGSLGD
jgi:RHS repeat-associated protein